MSDSTPLVRGEIQPTSVGEEAVGEPLARIATELAPYGLTLTQARIYVFLLTSGNTPVKTISKSLGVHRVDVYRELRELEQLGLLEMDLEVPRKFKAIEPKSAIGVLMKRQQEKVEHFRQRSTDLVFRLNELERATALGRQLGNTEPERVNSYKLVLGQKRYIVELKRLVRSARLEVLRILSSGGVIRSTFSHMDREYEAARARGIPVRMITELNDKNRNYVEELSRVVQLRHISGVNLRFTAVDKSITMLAARFDENSTSLDSPDDAYLPISDPRMSEAFCFFFEHLWENAKPIYVSR